MEIKYKKGIAHWKILISVLILDIFLMCPMIIKIMEKLYIIFDCYYQNLVYIWWWYKKINYLPHLAMFSNKIL
jgi:hypothetical protein